MTTPSPGPDPRLGGRTAHYDRSAVIASITSLYASLPHIPASELHLPPSSTTGWFSITPSTLAASGIHKTAEAVALLQQLPYISAHDPSTDPDPTSSHPWIQPECFPCDYRLVARGDDLSTRTRPGWMYDVRSSTAPSDDDESESASPPFPPPWVVQLTSGTDREGRCYMLDTSDGTITAHTVVRFEYEPSYAENDPRRWRDRWCEDSTLTVAEWVEEVKREWRSMEVLGVPPVATVEGEVAGAMERWWWPSLYFRKKGAGPGDWQWEEVEVSHVWSRDFLYGVIFVLHFLLSTLSGGLSVALLAPIDRTRSTNCENLLTETGL